MVASNRACVDVEAPDQAVLHAEDMPQPLVGQQPTLEVADGLVNLDDDLTLRPGREGHGLDMRIDARPLARPIAANAVSAMDMTALHAVGPGDVAMKDGKDSLDIARV